MRTTLSVVQPTFALVGGGDSGSVTSPSNTIAAAVPVLAAKTLDPSTGACGAIDRVTVRCAVPPE